MRYRYKPKVCPRCKEKNDPSAPKCIECGLIFARLKNASNRFAKKLILKGRRSEVVFVSDFPSDVINRWALLAFAIFLGPFGFHNIIVGNYYKGGFMLLFGILSSVYISLPAFSPAINIMMPIIVLPVAALTIMWITDIVNIVLFKFKVPVAIDIMEAK